MNFLQKKSIILFLTCVVATAIDTIQSVDAKQESSHLRRQRNVQEIVDRPDDLVLNVVDELEDIDIEESEETTDVVVVLDGEEIDLTEELEEEEESIDPSVLQELEEEEEEEAETEVIEEGPTEDPSVDTDMESNTDTTNPTTCTLQATLGYPYDDPDDADYYGYQASWLLVYRSTNNDDNDFCDSEKKDPEWCSYENTGGEDKTSAYIGNVCDYYGDWAAANDELYSEIFTMTESANNTFELYASHWFFETDYYTEFEEWSDHMFAPVLTVKNVETGLSLTDSEGVSSWTHEVDMDTRTHLPEVDTTTGLVTYNKNPDYKGDFYIHVTCDAACTCIVDDYQLLVA